jgi:hypothetical protein
VRNELAPRRRAEEAQMQGKAFVLIRSVVANPDDRAAFDRWYETGHFRLVFSKVAEVTEGWRFWSRSDPQCIIRLAGFQP